MRRNYDLVDILLHLTMIVLSGCAILLCIVLIVGIFTGISSMGKSNYEYIDTLGYKGYAERCYRDDVLYCIKEDGTNIQVIQYKDLGEE